MYKSLITAAALSAGLATGARAASLSMNEVVLADGTDLATCKASAAAAVAKVGLQAAGQSPGSVFGEGADGLIAAIYCLPQHGIAMIAIAGNSSEATRPVLAALLAAMNGE